MIMHPRITIIEITQQNTFLVINARTGILKPSLRTSVREIIIQLSQK